MLSLGDATRRGELDRVEIGDSEGVDSVAGEETAKISGELREHTGRGLMQSAARLETMVNGRLSLTCGGEDTILLGGAMTDTWTGGTFIAAAMSDDLAIGAGVRVTAPTDMWLNALTGMGGAAGNRRRRWGLHRSLRDVVRARVRPGDARRGGRAAIGKHLSDAEDELQAADEGGDGGAQPSPGRGCCGRGAAAADAAASGWGGGRGCGSGRDGGAHRHGGGGHHGARRERGAEHGEPLRTAPSGQSGHDAEPGGAAACAGHGERRRPAPCGRGAELGGAAACGREDDGGANVFRMSGAI